MNSDSGFSIWRRTSCTTGDQHVPKLGFIPGY